MRVKFTGILAFILLLILLSPITAFAQLFGADEENWRKVFLGLKKINHRLVTMENVELVNLKNDIENLLREIEEVKYAVPKLQGVVELNKAETLSGLNKNNAKLDDLAAEIKNRVFIKIQQQNKKLEFFREGLAQDMEKFEQASKTHFQDFAAVNNKILGQVVQELEAQSATTKKGFDDTIALFRTDVIPVMAEEIQANRKTIMDQLTQANKGTQKNLEAFSAKNQQLNKKLIEILQESLKQGLDTKSLLDDIKKDMGVIKEGLVGTNQKITNSHSVVTRVQKAIVVTNKNLIVADAKTNKLAKSLSALQVATVVTNKNLIVADAKTNKLAKSLSALQVQNTASNEALGALKADMVQGDEFNKLAIEILKSIVKEQATIKEALADLRRKANVNISRNDDIKKTLGKLGPAKK
jgi:hypothetical protein